MTDSYQQQRNAIERLDHSSALIERRADLAHRRREALNARKEQERINHKAIEGANARELMLLQFELNKENRILDYNLGIAEDQRAIEFYASELALKRYDDDIRNGWANQNSLLELETTVVKLLADRQTQMILSEQKHQQETAMSLQEHLQDMEAAILDGDIDVDTYKRKKTFDRDLDRANRNFTDDAITNTISKMMNEGKL